MTPQSKHAWNYGHSSMVAITDAISLNISQPKKCTNPRTCGHWIILHSCFVSTGSATFNWKSLSKQIAESLIKHFNVTSSSGLLLAFNSVYFQKLWRLTWMASVDVLYKKLLKSLSLRPHVQWWRYPMCTALINFHFVVISSVTVPPLLGLHILGSAAFGAMMIWSNFKFLEAQTVQAASVRR